MEIMLGGKSRRSHTITDFCNARGHESAVEEVRTNKGAEFLGDRAQSGSVKVCRSLRKVARSHLFYF